MSFKTWYARFKNTSMYAQRWGWLESVMHQAFKAGIAYERSLQKRRKVNKQGN